jgi:hypothetical protein
MTFATKSARSGTPGPLFRGRERHYGDGWRVRVTAHEIAGDPFVTLLAGFRPDKPALVLRLPSV